MHTALHKLQAKLAAIGIASISKSSPSGVYLIPQDDILPNMSYQEKDHFKIHNAQSNEVIVGVSWWLEHVQEMAKIALALPRLQEECNLHLDSLYSDSGTIESAEWWISPTVQVEWLPKQDKIITFTKEEDEQLNLEVDINTLPSIIRFIERSGAFSGWAPATAAWMKEIHSNAGLQSLSMELVINKKQQEILRVIGTQGDVKIKRLKDRVDLKYELKDSVGSVFEHREMRAFLQWTEADGNDLLARMPSLKQMENDMQKSKQKALTQEVAQLLESDIELE